jgi:NAD(P)-dependent dehydrogenase (short-subunit alcohol dehydrogenase family)
LYAGTKAAVLAMTKELAVELAPRKIRVNSVSPGIIPSSGRIDWLCKQLHEPYSSQFRAEFEPHMAEWMSTSQPLTMIGHGHDVGLACYYLCTPAARFVTGEDIRVDGGKHLEMHEGEPRFYNNQPVFFKRVRMHLTGLPEEAWKGEKPRWLRAKPKA